MCISQVISLFIGINWLNTFLIPLCIYFISFVLLKKEKVKLCRFDILFFLLLALPFVGWIFNSYPHKGILIFRYYMGECAFMFAYVIGRMLPIKHTYKIFQYSIKPAFICAILGFVFYVVQPQWYMNQITDFASLEQLRLRSIFASPYTCSYMSFFMIAFLLANDFKLIPNYQFYIQSKLKIVLYVVFTTLLLFCMMRAPIAGCCISLMLAALYAAFVKHNFKILIYTLIAAVIGLASIKITLDYFMDEKSQEFLLDKFTLATDKDSDFISNRATLYEAQETLFGDGAGRHPIYAEDYGEVSIRDTCYQRLLQEVGWIGLIVYMIIFIGIILKCILYYKHLIFELGVLLFLLLSMIGADPLATPDKHCLFYWLIIGRVAGYKGSSAIKLYMRKIKINN
jgi:hypothetical protein